MDYPFRLDPQPAEHDAWMRENERQDRKRAARFEMAGMALNRIRYAKSASRDRLRSWVEHPDERVVAEIMRRWLDLAANADRSWLREMMMVRVLTDALREGALWTPLLDLALERGILDTARSMPRRSWSDLEERDPRPPEIGPGETPQERLEAWIQDDVDPAHAVALAEGTRARSIRRMIAERANPLAPELLEALLRKGEVLGVVENPVLSDEQAMRLKEAAFARLRQAAKGGSRSSVPVHLRFISDDFQASSVLQTLISRGFEWLERDRDEMFEMLVPSKPQKTGWDRREISGTVSRQVAWRVLRHEGSGAHTSDWILRLYERVRHEPDLVLELVRDEATDAHAARTILSDTRVRRVRRHLAHDERFHSDPVIRDTLSSSRSMPVLKGLVESAEEAEEYRTLFRRLAEVDPLGALKHLEQMGPGEERAAWLRQEDLAPLLANGSRDVRLRSIQVLAEQRERADGGGQQVDEEERGAHARPRGR